MLGSLNSLSSSIYTLLISSFPIMTSFVNFMFILGLFSVMFILWIVLSILYPSPALTSFMKYIPYGMFLIFTVDVLSIFS